jgi:hypothetical protein
MEHNIYLIEKNEKTYVAKVKGFVPKDAVGRVENSVDPEDYPYLRSREVPNPDFPEEIIREMYVDEDAKAAGVLAQTQNRRNSKLAQLRILRDQKLLDCDNIVRDLALGLRSDQILIREYRQALKDITEDYKYVNDVNKGKASLDAFEDDMSDFVWPAKP